MARRGSQRRYHRRWATSTASFVGIDVRTDHRDVHGRPAGTARRFPNTDAGHRQVVRFLAPLAPTLLALEATGGCERPVVAAPAVAGLPVAVVNPARVRAFAKALGRLAKTDAVGAAILAAFADEVRPVARPRPDDATRHVQARIGLRRDLVGPRTDAGNRATAATDRSVLRSRRALARVRERELARVEKGLDASPTWQAQAELLETVPGIGPVRSRTLLAGVPELGTRSREQVASPVGVAPLNWDGGQHRGHRRVQGGRAEVRRVPYMAALSARTSNGTLNVFADRLAAAGKAGKVVIIAVARKLLVIANAVLRDNRPWQPQVA